MDHLPSLDYVDGIIKCINTNRAKSGLADVFLAAVDLSLDNVYSSTEVIDGIDLIDKNDNEIYQIIQSKVGELPPESEVFNRFVTHVDAVISESDEDSNTNTLRIISYYKHLEVEQYGNAIDGDLVIQGACVTGEFGPVLCVVEYAADHEEEYLEVTKVLPWDMMYTPSGESTFAIPISIGANRIEGSVRVSVYVTDTTAISYSEEDLNFDSSTHSYACALKFTTRAVSGNYIEPSPAGDLLNTRQDSLQSISSNKNGDINDIKEVKDSIPSNSNDIYEVVKDVKMALDFDDLQQLRAEGYEFLVTYVTADGPVFDQEHLWKFYVCASYGPSNEIGVEDVVWIKCLKSMGALPVLPLYEIFHDYDLSDTHDLYSVYFGVRRGENPRFKKFSMISASSEDDEGYEAYVASQNALYRPAPSELCNLMGGPAGMMLDLAYGDIAEVRADFAMEKFKTGTSSRPGTAEEDSDGHEPFGRDNDDLSDNEEADEFFGVDNDEAVEILTKRVSSLEAEREYLKMQNSDLQKKSALFIAREKLLQGQSSNTKTAAEVAQQSFQEAEILVDVMLEKEKLFHDILKQIAEARNKYEQQIVEFDQLALDLQTRLDDKEFKVTEIGESFKKFKREILTTAVNSRTGQPISNRLVSQLETNEQKHDEDLEKVRLRNISLRTTLKKLERALRSREQLAEGLHMIDFEQLKIENQTLNEKIEERNEELSKLKRKKTTTVQVLTHVREKLRFIDKSNIVKSEELRKFEEEILGLRGSLTGDKHDRDFIRTDNKELKRQQGFAASDLLIVDFETRKEGLNDIKSKINEYQDRYQILLRQVESLTVHPAKQQSVIEAYKAASNNSNASKKLPALGFPSFV